MAGRGDIGKGAITNGHISNQAKIDPGKLAPGEEASLLIAQARGKYKSVKLSGGIQLLSDGQVKVLEGVEEESLPIDSVKIGPSADDFPARDNKTLKVSETGAGNIVKRNSDDEVVGDITGNAPTADYADDADKLDGQEGTFYQDVTNNTFPDPVNSVANGLNLTTYEKPHKIINANNNDNSGPTEYKVEHNFGYIPEVSVFLKSGEKLLEVDAEVESSTTESTIRVSEALLDLRFAVQ